MSYTGEELANAIVQLAKGNQVSYNTTITATITSVDNIEKGSYKIAYQGNTFIAYATTGTYDVGDTVYVKVPNGDFTQIKLIEYKVSSNKVDTDELFELNNRYENTGVNLNQVYQGIPKDEIGMIAGVSKLEEYPLTADNARLFAEYAHKYPYLKISAAFKTLFNRTDMSGNYGVKIIFNNEKELILDTTLFNGSLYYYPEYVTQSMAYELTEDFIDASVAKIQVFENLTTDTYYDGTPNIKNDNIFIKDISIDFCEHLELEAEKYTLYTTTPQGSIFTTDSGQQLKISGILFYGYNNLTQDSKFYWYKRNPASTETSKPAGPGWDKLNGGVAAPEIEVSEHGIYKVFAYYKDVLAAEKEIILTKAAKYYLKFDDETLKLALGIYDLNTDKLVQSQAAKWTLIFPDDSREVLTDTSTLLDLKPYKKYAMIRIICEIDDYILEQVIYSEGVSEDIPITWYGNSVFKYDANGDMDINFAQSVQSLSFDFLQEYEADEINWKLGQHDLKDDEFIDITNSMIVKAKLDSEDNKKVYFYINPKYNDNYINNTFSIEVKDKLGNKNCYNKEIIFLKDGDNGTNGTTYSLIISADKQVLQPGVGMTLTATIYRDGEKVTTDVSSQYKWTIQSKNITGTSVTNQINLAADSNIPNQSSYVSCEAIIDSLRLTSLYPIAIMHNGNVSDVDLTNLPKFIQYNALGAKPKIMGTSHIMYYKGEAITPSIIKRVAVRSYSENKFIPYNTYIPNEENTMSLIAYNCGNNVMIYYTIISYLNTYGHERINGWDGTSVDMNNGTILSPQLIAGVKDSDNHFTGLVLGKDTTATINQIGLHGYDKGTATFGLETDGSAWFGVGKQLQLTGTSATIKGVPVEGSSSAGMVINLIGSGAKDAINVNNGTFKVDYNGNLTAESGTFGGSLDGASGTFDGTVSSDATISNNVTAQTMQIKNGSATYGTIGLGYGAVPSQTGTDKTPGIVLASPNGTPYIIVTTAGIRLQTANNNLVVTDNGVWINGSTIKPDEISITAKWG